MDISPGTTDSELVQLSLQNSDYFAVLIERYEQKLTRYIRRRSSASSEDVQDVLQDIFIKTYINLNDFDTSLSFSSWIYRIAHNQIISWYRKHNVRNRNRINNDTGDEFLVLARDVLDISEQHWTQEMKTTIARSLEKLSEKYREIILLRFFEEKDYDEISDILQIPPGTVATNIARAKKKLHTLLAPHL